MTRQQKEREQEAFGVKQQYLLRFSDVMHLTPEQFVDEVLVKVCHAGRVCCGFNFTFGAGGRADSGDLRRLCAARGIETAVASAVMDGGAPISSTRIRALVAKGDMDAAARLLGRPYGYLGAVQHGKQLGRRLGTPTLNQQIPAAFVLPRFGVYASEVYLHGQAWCGVTNVGLRPTVNGTCVNAETWLPAYSGGEFYGEEVRTDLLHFLRPEQKFASVEELGEQIHRDGEAAQMFVSQRREILFA